MKKQFLVFALAAVISVQIPALASCDKHEHLYDWYVTREATCEKKGEIEGICNGCGKKIYQSLQTIAHDYGDDGYCKTCGKDETGRTPDDQTTLPEISESTGFTLSSIYDQSTLLGYTYTKAAFLEFLSYARMENLYFNSFNHLRLTIHGYSFSAGAIKEDFVYPWLNTLNNVAQVFLTSSNGQEYFGSPKLFVVTTDGTQTDYGYVKDFFTGETDEALLERVVINKQNELIFIYDNQTVKKAGKIADDKTDVDTSSLIYAKETDGYYVVGAMRRNIETLTVPETHRGLPVVGISSFAFSSERAPNLKTADLSSKNLKIIDSSAFFASPLTSVKIGINVERINWYAFDSSALQKATFLDAEGWAYGYNKDTYDESTLTTVSFTDESAAAKQLTNAYHYTFYKTT